MVSRLTLVVSMAVHPPAARDFRTTTPDDGRHYWPQIRDAMAANLPTLASCEAPLAAVSTAYGAHVPLLTISRQDERNTLVRKVPVDNPQGREQQRTTWYNDSNDIRAVQARMRRDRNCTQDPYDLRSFDFLDFRHLSSSA